MEEQFNKLSIGENDSHGEIHSEENEDIHHDFTSQTGEHCNLIINYLPHDIDDVSLKAIFADFGEIIMTKVVRDKNTKKSLGYGFVKFMKESDAMLAIEKMNGFALGHKNLKVSVARPPSLEIRNCKLYVTNLPKDYTEREVVLLFKEFGEIIECRVLKDRNSRSNKGVAFVQFNLKAQANNALSLNGCQLEGSTRGLVVKYAEDQHKKKELSRLHTLTSNNPYSRAATASSSNNNMGGMMMNQQQNMMMGGGGGGGKYKQHHQHQQQSELEPLPTYYYQQQQQLQQHQQQQQQHMYDPNSPILIPSPISSPHGQSHHHHHHGGGGAGLSMYLPTNTVGGNPTINMLDYSPTISNNKRFNNNLNNNNIMGPMGNNNNNINKGKSNLSFPIELTSDQNAWYNNMPQQHMQFMQTALPNSPVHNVHGGGGGGIPHNLMNSPPAPHHHQHHHQLDMHTNNANALNNTTVPSMMSSSGSMSSSTGSVGPQNTLHHHQQQSQQQQGQYTRMGGQPQPQQQIRIQVNSMMMPQQQQLQPPAPPAIQQQSPPQQYSGSVTLNISNLPSHADVALLHQLISPYGRILSAQIDVDTAAQMNARLAGGNSNRVSVCSGRGRVQMAGLQQAQYAAQNLNGAVIFDGAAPIQVSIVLNGNGMMSN